MYIVLSKREGFSRDNCEKKRIICKAAAVGERAKGPTEEPASSRPTGKKFSKLFDESRSKGLANICENSHFWGCRTGTGGRVGLIGKQGGVKRAVFGRSHPSWGRHTDTHTDAGRGLNISAQQEN